MSSTRSPDARSTAVRWSHTRKRSAKRSMASRESRQSVQDRRPLISFEIPRSAARGA